VNHRDQLELVTQELLKRETLDAEAFNLLLGRPPNAPIGEDDGRAPGPHVITTEA
jgi:hypothetical protein